MLLISLWVAVHSRPHAQVLADNRFSIIIHRLLIVSESLLHLKPCLQKSSKYPQMWKSHCVYLIGNSIIVVPLRCDSQIISLCNVSFDCVPSHDIFSANCYMFCDMHMNSWKRVFLRCFDWITYFWTYGIRERLPALHLIRKYHVLVVWYTHFVPTT